VFEDGERQNYPALSLPLGRQPENMERVPDVSLRELSKALPACCGGEEGQVVNLLDEVARHRIDGMDVLVSGSG
jgi:hypothetical protein